MHFFNKSLASAFLFASAQAAYLNDLSFGHNDGKISPSLRAIPNFHLMGTPNPPEILSNKIILTPPAPGNSRGAIWAEKPLKHSEWTVEVDFRATGPERGGGNLQIWYALDGQEHIGTSSIYTAGRFHGLAVVIDQYAGSGGFIRGFLNDGSKEYKSHHSVDSLAFGHCLYPYRNLGRFSRLTISQTPNYFKVSLDGSLCFESTKIKLPLDYSFGISAASAETPDSFEVSKFVTESDSHTPDVETSGQAKPNFMGSKDGKQEEQKRSDDIPAFSDLPEVSASKVSSSEQFADLHNRLQGLTRMITFISRELMQDKTLADSHHEDLLSLLNSISSNAVNVPSILQKLDRIDGLERKLDRVGDDVRQTKADLHDALDQHVVGLKNEVRSTHSSLLGSVKAGSLGWGSFFLIVVGSQVVTVGAYMIYKKKKNGGMKKYL